jgi:hypothetical protein
MKRAVKCDFCLDTIESLVYHVIRHNFRYRADAKCLKYGDMIVTGRGKNDVVRYEYQ